MLRSCKLKPTALLTSLMIGILLTGQAWSKQYVELKGARFPAQLNTHNGTLQLQGAGILKWRVLFDVYAAAYYVNPMSPQHERLIIHYFLPIQAQQIKTAAEKHLLKQHGQDFFNDIKPALDRLHAAMQDVDSGDSYAINLSLDGALALEHNGETILRLNQPQLGRAYLDIWLGTNPLDERLRLSLLGSE